MKLIFCLMILLLLCCTSSPKIEQLETEVNTKPKYIIDYVDSMKQTYKSFEKYRFYYDTNENAVVEIVLINTKDERKKRNIKQTWKGNESSIGNNEKKYTNTKKQLDEINRRIEERRKNSIFTEIEKVILQIAYEYQYDFEKAYGIEAKYRNPNIKKAVCDGYANAVLKAFENHPLVEKVEKWTSEKGKHAWNVIILKDGRKIYCDATWYQGQKIDNEGYVVEIPNKNPVNLTYDIEEFNSLGGAIDNATGETLKVHLAWEDSNLNN